MGLQEQTVLVTGAGRGLGRAIARAFSKAGAYVVINYFRSREAAESLAGELGSRCFPVACDIRDEAEVRRMIAEVEARQGPVDALVNNAIADYRFNGDQRSRVPGLTWEEIDLQLQTSIRGSLNVINGLATQMSANGGGSIVNIGSNLFQSPVVPYHDYTIAKGALLSLTRTCAADLGPLNIRVNMVSAGLLRTTDASSATPQAVFDAVQSASFLRRVTAPDEVADAVVFLASPAARAITGQNLIVDCGLVCG